MLFFRLDGGSGMDDVGRSLAFRDAAMPQSGPARVALYASVGPELTQYDIDVEAAALTRGGTISLPANVTTPGRMLRAGISMSRQATPRRGWGRPAQSITSARFASICARARFPRMGNRSHCRRARYT